MSSSEEHASGGLRRDAHHTTQPTGDEPDATVVPPLPTGVPGQASESLGTPVPAPSTGQGITGGSAGTGAPVITGSYGGASGVSGTAAGSGGSSGGSGGVSGTAETAKHEAGDVASTAASEAGNVASTAKEEAAAVAAEAKTQVKDLYQQTRSELREQAATQQTRVADGLKSIGHELQSMADSSEDQGIAADLVRQVSSRVSGAGSWLGNREPESLLSEVKSYARRNPGTFIAVAALAGLAAGRLTRALTDNAADQKDATAGPQENGQPLA